MFEDLVRRSPTRVEAYEIRRAAGQKTKAVQDLAHFVQLTQNVGKSQNLTQLATHLVNDFAKSTGADRVCFFRPNGKLLAVSGVSQAALKTTWPKACHALPAWPKPSGQPIESTENQVGIGDPHSLGRSAQLTAGLDSDIVYVAPLINAWPLLRDGLGRIF